MKYKHSEKEFRKAVNNSKSIAGVCRYLGIKVAGGNYKTVKKRIKQYDIDISHFTGKGWNVGLKFKPSKKRPLSDVLKKDSPFRTSHLRKRLLQEGVKEHVCESCIRDVWMDNPIPLELHHIDGDSYNNELTNIELLCPNCHALTDNYRGRNINKRVA